MRDHAAGVGLLLTGITAISYGRGGWENRLLEIFGRTLGRSPDVGLAPPEGG